MSEEQVWQLNIHIEGEGQSLARLATVPGHVPWHEVVDRWTWQGVRGLIERHGGPNSIERIELVLKRTALGGAGRDAQKGGGR